MTKPITPDEVEALQEQVLPDAVFDVFNELIAKHWSGHDAVVIQDEAVNRITERLSCARGEVFAKGYLDVESAYRKAGWYVKYDKPGYNESYQAFFRFQREP